MLHLWSSVQSNYPKCVHRPRETGFPRAGSVKSGNSHSTHPSVCPVAPLTLTAFNHGTACNYFQVHIIQEDVWHFFLIHDWPHFLISLCKQADKPFLRMSFEPWLWDKLANFKQVWNNLTFLETAWGWEAEWKWNTTDLSLTGRNAGLVTTHCNGCSWTSMQIAPDWKRIQQDLPKRRH